MTTHEIVDELAAIFRTLTGYNEQLPHAETDVRVPPSAERGAVMVHRLRMRLVGEYMEGRDAGPQDDSSLRRLG